jgi:hypothetical protein
LIVEGIWFALLCPHELEKKEEEEEAKRAKLLAGLTCAQL